MTRVARSAVALAVAGAAATNFALSQQDVVADPTHHKPEFENDCVRVVRAGFQPQEKSDGTFDTRSVVVVELLGGPGLKVILPDGTSVERLPQGPGAVYWVPGGLRMAVENTGDTRVEYLVIEPKPGCSN